MSSIVILQLVIKFFNMYEKKLDVDGHPRNA